MLTVDEKKLLIDLVRCVKLIGWHVKELREGEAKNELQSVLDNLDAIYRTIDSTIP